MTTEFKAWPKTPRLFRSVIITEKIDGTNAAVIIERADENADDVMYRSDAVVTRSGWFYVNAQSRSRIIVPAADNFGFAAWVRANAVYLAETLGEGYHYGEWWGQGIQRRYGMSKKVFSLFNVRRWWDVTFELDDLRLVPVLYRGTYSERAVELALAELREFGSRAATFDNPEGICVFHEDANQVFKVLLENDHLPKSAVA